MIQKNDVFGRLTAIKRMRRNQWLCSCSCGKEVIIPGGQLTNFKRRSCGCAVKKSDRDFNVSGVVINFISENPKSSKDISDEMTRKYKEKIPRDTITTALGRLYWEGKIDKEIKNKHVFWLKKRDLLDPFIYGRLFIHNSTPRSI